MGVNRYGPCWFKGNKANQKWSEADVLKIFEETTQWLYDNPKITLVNEIFIHIMVEHGVCQDTWYSWINNIYKDNKRIKILYKFMRQILEKRAVYDEFRQLRPNIQALVLQSHHNYHTKQNSENTDEQKITHEISGLTTEELRKLVAVCRESSSK